MTDIEFIVSLERGANHPSFYCADMPLKEFRRLESLAQYSVEMVRIPGTDAVRVAAYAYALAVAHARENVEQSLVQALLR